MTRKCILTRFQTDLVSLEINSPKIKWVHFPLINFDTIDIPNYQLQKLTEYNWLIFTSQNAVLSFFEQVIVKNKIKIAAVGPKTAGTIKSMGYKVDFVPSHTTSQALAEEIPISKEESVCYVGGNLSNPKTINILKNRAKSLSKIEVYRTKKSLHSEFEWSVIMNPAPEFIAFASPSAVESYISQIKQHGINPPLSINYAAIGNTTAKAINSRLGCRAFLGEKHTFESMIEAINKYLL